MISVKDFAVFLPKQCVIIPFANILHKNLINFYNWSLTQAFCKRTNNYKSEIS